MCSSVLRAAVILSTEASAKITIAIPKPKTLRKDLVACGIKPVDELGQLIDFHALRHTACTTFQCYGVGQRAAQHQMRHSDPRLTAKVYMDESLLPVAAELEKVKVFRPLPAGSQRASQNLGKFREKTGNVDHLDEVAELTQGAESQRESLSLSNVGTPWPEAKNGGEGGIRTHPPAPPRPRE